MHLAYGYLFLCAALQGVLSLPRQRQGPLGYVVSRLATEWRRGMPCEEAWEFTKAAEVDASACWKSYRHSMKVCLSCFELSVHQSEMPGMSTRCACSSEGNGWKPMPQTMRDTKAAQARATAQARSPPRSPPVATRSPRRRQPAGPTGCKLLSFSDSSSTSGDGSTAQMYVAVPRVLHGVGRRDRWVIVRLALDSSGQASSVGTCSHPECVSERQVRLASGSTHVSCEHVEAARSECMSYGGGELPVGWGAALARRAAMDREVSLDGCLAHVASGSSRWACGGLRQCEPCGFSKQDVEAESRSHVSAHTDELHPGAHTDESHPGAHTNEAESKAAPVRRSSRLAGLSGLQVPHCWFVPEGWCVQQKAPDAEALDDLEEALKFLLNKRIMYNWLPPVCACTTRWP